MNHGLRLSRSIAELAATALAVGFAVFVTSCALRHAPRDAEADDARGDGNVTPDAGCPAGMQRCSGTCVAVDTTTRCGSCSNDCTGLPGVNAAAVHCTAGRCDFTNACLQNQADCDRDPVTGCERLVTDINNCGACRTVCSGSTGVCSRDTASGAYSCTNGCPPGTTLCGSGTCADLATDPMNCNACGAVCPSLPGAIATCAAGVCRSTCNSGTHLCSGRCVPDDSTTLCGSGCMACPADPNGAATCTTGTCAIRCNTSYHLCAGVCVSNASVMNCGTSCTPCLTGGNQVATCDSLTCGVMCSGGYHDCSGTCSPNNSITSCGTSCSPCSPPGNSTATCSATGLCGYLCNSGYADMSGGCVRLCGNQSLEPGEACDDGAATDLDGCSSSCQVESGVIVPSACPTNAGITITRAGTYIFSGNTNALTNAVTNCGAGGPEQGLSASINLGRTFTITVTLRPTTRWDAVLRHGLNCGSLTCLDANGPGVSESYTPAASTLTTGVYVWVVDGKGGMNNGPWTLTIQII